MISIHRANERGKSDLGWLKSRFSFSFAEYFNPKRMNFGALRVLNDDEIAPAQGFGAHPHKNMEIITIVFEGEIAHKDNTGSSGITKAGDVQVMSAGFGVVHSEFNNSKKQVAKLFQIWIDTKEKGIKPRYDQMKFDKKDFDEKFRIVASGIKSNSQLYIHQDAKISIGYFKKEKEVEINIPKGKGLFLMLEDGKLLVGKENINKRDSVEISNISKLKFKTKEDSKIIAIEVPMI